MLTTALIYLCAAVISVPIAKRLGLGSVLGYLLAGIIIGPYALSLVGDQTELMHFAEFGVVMMLFLIGLELKPSLLWNMRRPILGLGGLQVVLSTIAITAAVMLFSDLENKTALAIGLALALSSTAIVIQSLSEKGLLKTQAGNNAFAVLLFQDIAVIPILAILPLLALSTGHHVDGGDGHGETSLIADLPVWAQVSVTLGTVLAIIMGGRFLATPAFRFIAETRLREIFTAFALLIVIAISALMGMIGLSAALGTFLAGVVLAESEFRHELEADIEPFKGLLLGLFFITVGAGINFQLLTESPVFIVVCVIALVAIKAAVLAFLAIIFKLGMRPGSLFSLSLAQGGEFAFVLVAAGTTLMVFPTEIGNTINLVVALSMLLSPLFLLGYEWYFSRIPAQDDEQQPDDITTQGEVIVAGYGRFGQIIGRLLVAQNYKLTIVDHSPGQIEMVRRFGNEVYYGDPSRLDLLAAAGAENAKLLVVAVDERDKAMEIIRNCQKHFPHVKILARAIDRRHAYDMVEAKIDGFRRETFDSALYLGVEALKILGQDDVSAKRAGDLFAEHDEKSLAMLADLWGDDTSYGAAIRQRTEDLRKVLESDRTEFEGDADTESVQEQ